MVRYFLSRIVRGIVTLIAVSILVFVLTHLLGDPAVMMLPIDASNELLGATRESLGLNDPIEVQFAKFSLNAVTGDFGPSMYSGVSSRDLLFRSLPATAILASVAFTVAILLGVSLGILASLRPRSWIDNLVSAISIGGISMPEFWLALLLIVGVAIPFGFVPTSGYGSWQHIILPAIVLSVRPTGRIAQVTRSAMVDEMRQQYVMTAHSKGLTTAAIIWRHVLKNAGIPIITMAGLEMADLISGAIVVETIFGWPGVGWLAGNALRTIDFPVIQTVVLWAALITVSINLAVDLAYAWLNPRIRYS